jgi:hypothetical protein
VTAAIQTEAEPLDGIVDDRLATLAKPTQATPPIASTPVSMAIKPSHIEALKALGYTEAEARFLYVVATHSGYFAARQFLSFTGAHWGKRTTTFWSKLQTLHHARRECFPKAGVVHHLFSRRLYIFRVERRVHWRRLVQPHPELRRVCYGHFRFARRFLGSTCIPELDRAARRSSDRRHHHWSSKRVL